MSNDKSKGKADSAPGQQHEVTIFDASGQPHQMKRYEVRNRREELRAAGYTGPGLSDTDDEPEVEGQTPEAGGGSSES